MADTQEFNNLVFDVSRFSDVLMEELYATCPSQLRINGRALIIKHCYVERRMNPLNLYLQEASDEEVNEVMNDYGNAIKQLAAANIFPGDMLLKNFGVTRHGRVVFYDYDEIEPLLDCNFRRIPPPRDEMDEIDEEETNPLIIHEITGAANVSNHELVSEESFKAVMESLEEAT